MRRKRSLQDLSVNELRWLLVEKRRSDRQARLAHFRKTGRIIELAPGNKGSAQEASTARWNDVAIIGETVERSALRRFFDKLLLLVEIIAVIGLIVILLNGLNILEELNREVVKVLEQPTLTPTPLITAVILPSGHTPPDSPGGAQPNLFEIPQHLQPLVQSLANISLPTPGPEQAVRIQIPVIGVDAPVVQGDGWEQLKKGVGQHINTANPGQPGNVVLSAHNDIFGEIFRDLDRLKPGDQIILFSSQRTYTYIVTDVKIVEPTQVEVMAPTTNATLTLISCYPYRVDDKRIVVFAHYQGGS